MEGMGSWNSSSMPFKIRRAKVLSSSSGMAGGTQGSSCGCPLATRSTAMAICMTRPILAASVKWAIFSS